MSRESRLLRYAGAVSEKVRGAAELRTVRLPPEAMMPGAVARAGEGTSREVAGGPAPRTLVEQPLEAAPAVGAPGSAGAPGAAGAPALRSRQAIVEGLGAGSLVGSYELVRPIGRGGAGAVFLARDLKLGRRVALKLLLSSDGALARRFLVEAQATARCVHENIVVIHEVGAWQGIPYLVLEYLDGPALSSLLAEAPLPLARALELMAPVVRALGCAHAADIVHRDLKPDNIIVTRGGAVKVVDFGIAKWFRGGGEVGGAGPSEGREPREGGDEGEGGEGGVVGGGDYETLSGPGALVGTLAYMAPEQWRGEEIDARCDVFAVGMILFRLLTGAHPSGLLSGQWTPRALREVALAAAPYASIGEAAPGLPAAAVALVDRCLRKAPGERPASAAALLAELEEVRRGGEREAEAAARRVALEECPYPGLSQFTAGEAGRFFGRSREGQAALAILRRTPVLAVVGPSGSGKSSLVLAGVAPALQREAAAGGGRVGGCEVLALRPGRAPLSALIDAVARLRGGDGAKGAEGADGAEEGNASGARLSEAQLRAEPGRLGRVLRERCGARGATMLVIVDQLEELFTLESVRVPDGLGQHGGGEGGDAATAARRVFLDALLSAADDVSSPIRLALTVRADFLPRLAEHAWLAEAVRDGMLLLTPPDRTSLRAALVGPPAQLGYQLEDEALVEEIVAALETSAVPLPLLQLVGAQLWSRRDRQARQLSRQAYRQLGGVHGALAGQADDVLAGLSPAGRKLVRALLLRLVTGQGTRAVVDRAELLAMSPEAAAVLGSLVAARLVVVHEDDASVELIHEALIEQWPALRRWMQESRAEVALRDRLAGAARQWHEAGRPAGLLWAGEALEDIRALLAREVAPEAALGGLAREFAAASDALATRATRRRRALVTAALAALALVALAAVIALAAVRRAEEAAQDQAVLAEGEAGRARAAERSLSEKVRELQEKERQRRAAEQIAEERRGQVERSQGELEGALRDSQAAQRAAEEAAARARELAGQERVLRQELGQALARERKRVEELQQKRSKIEQRLR